MYSNKICLMCVNTYVYKHINIFFVRTLKIRINTRPIIDEFSQVLLPLVSHFAQILIMFLGVINK